MPEIRELIREGKGKRVYATDDPELAVVYYKDEAMAFHGLKRGRILGKGEVNNAVCEHLFTLLRENGIELPVLILGFTPAGMAKELADNNISQAVFSEEYAKELSDEAVKQNVNVKIHIKLDTGMSRIGFMYQNMMRDSDSLE